MPDDAKLTHTNEQGEAHMVDVAHKQPTRRDAWAESIVVMSVEAWNAVKANSVKKGDVLSVARIAGIMAAKRTHELIPLCHPLKLSKIEVKLLPDAQPSLGSLDLRDDQRSIIVQAHVRALDLTGVEMEALTAASVAALTVYDMLKAIDKAIEIRSTHLLKKLGGKSGDVLFAEPH